MSKRNIYLDRPKLSIKKPRIYRREYNYNWCSKDFYDKISHKCRFDIP